MMLGRVVEFVMGPTGKILIGIVALIAWTGFHRMDAARSARASCELAHSDAALVAEQEKAREAEKIAEAAEQRAKAARAELAELEKVADEIRNLEDGGGCELPPDVAERLRGIQ